MDRGMWGVEGRGGCAEYVGKGLSELSPVSTVAAEGGWRRPCPWCLIGLELGLNLSVDASCGSLPSAAGWRKAPVLPSQCSISFPLSYTLTSRSPPSCMCFCV